MAALESPPLSRAARLSESSQPSTHADLPAIPTPEPIVRELQRIDRAEPREQLRSPECRPPPSGTP